MQKKFEAWESADSMMIPSPSSYITADETMHPQEKETYLMETMTEKLAPPPPSAWVVERTHPDAKLPRRCSKGAAGYDFWTPTAFIVPPRGDAKVSLGLKMMFPDGWGLVLLEKSGLAVNKKLDVGACLIDSDYRGEVHVHLFNNSDQEVSFKAGDKVVQGILIPCYGGEVFEGPVLDITDRGEGGFGSTGSR